jgi:antitoxin HigA-1
MARTPIQPGEHLADALTELNISAAELAPDRRASESSHGIINGQHAITVDTAPRLGHWFGTSPEFRLNLQKLYECAWCARKLATVWKGFPNLRKASTRKRSLSGREL